MKCRKKPIEIEAVQLTAKQDIQTPNGPVTVEAGDWVITGFKGEQYPCKNDVFTATYEPINESQVQPMSPEDRMEKLISQIHMLTVKGPEYFNLPRQMSSGSIVPAVFWPREWIVEAIRQAEQAVRQMCERAMVERDEAVQHLRTTRVRERDEAYQRGQAEMQQKWADAYGGLLLSHGTTKAGFEIQPWGAVPLPAPQPAPPPTPRYDEKPQAPLSDRTKGDAPRND
jgi:hypothetical protein